MAEIIEARVIQKIATAPEWASSTITPYKGEIMLVSDSTGKVFNLKVGDGMNKFPELTYAFDSIQQNANYVPTTGGVLPTPSVDSAFTILGDGAYTGGGSIPANEGVMRIASWDGSAWTVVGEVDMPTMPIANVVVEGGDDAVSQDAVYNYVEDETSRISLYDKMELPDPFVTVILNNILNQNNFNQIWGTNIGSAMTVSNNVGTFTATGAGGRATSNITGVSIGDKIYVKIDVKVDSNQVRAYIPGRSGGKYTSGSGEWESLSFIEEAAVEPNQILRIIDNRTSGWTPIQLRKGVAINLTTTFGAGNEPTIEKIESVLSNLPYMWFEGTTEYNDPLMTEGMTFVNKGGVMVMGYPSSGRVLKVVCFGDSITEIGGYPRQMANLTGYNVINVGIGGTRLTDRGDPQYYDDLAFTKLVDAITSGDFTAQDAAITHLSERAQDNYNTLKSIDWATVDIIVFMYGTNDYTGTGLVMGNDDDTVTYRNFKGGLNHVLTKLSQSFPNILLYPVTSIFRLRDGYDNSDDAPGASGLYLYDLAKAVVDLSKKYHVPCLDLYNNSGINKYNALEYLVDGTHPTLRDMI